MEIYILQEHISHGIEKFAATVHHRLLPVCKLSLVFIWLPFDCKQSHEIRKQGLITWIEHNPFPVMICLGFIISTLPDRWLLPGIIKLIAQNASNVFAAPPCSTILPSMTLSISTPVTSNVPSSRFPFTPRMTTPPDVLANDEYVSQKDRGSLSPASLHSRCICS